MLVHLKAEAGSGERGSGHAAYRQKLSLHGSCRLIQLEMVWAVVVAVQYKHERGHHQTLLADLHVLIPGENWPLYFPPALGQTFPENAALFYKSRQNGFSLFTDCE